jgi:integrase
VPGTPHGLRKAAASRLAQFGCTEREIMAITGHTTSKEVDRYAKSARQKVLAKSAMDKMLKPHCNSFRTVSSEAFGPHQPKRAAQVR